MAYKSRAGSTPARGTGNYMHYVYVLLTQSKKLYIGRTSDLKRRLQEHKGQKVKTTKRLKPIKLIFYEVFLAKTDAVRRERYFKTSKGKRSLKLMLQDSLLSI